MFYSFFQTKTQFYKTILQKNADWKYQDFATPNNSLKIMFQLDEDQSYESAFKKVKENKNYEQRKGTVNGRILIQILLKSDSDGRNLFKQFERMDFITLFGLII